MKKQDWWVVALLVVLFLSCLTTSGQTVNDLRPTVTMKEYVDMQAQLNKEWLQKLMDVQVENIKDNVTKANQAMEKRLDGINEFRGQLKDQAGTFITRSELWGYVIAILGLLIGAIGLMRRQAASAAGKNIVSGDKVEVKK